MCSRDKAAQWYLTQRFSRLALISVVVLVVSGFFMSISYVGSWHALIGTSYGLMLLAKIAMLGAMLALGGINFLMLRKYSPGETIPRLRRLVEAEVGIGLTIILTAASMTAQPPAVDLPNDTVQCRISCSVSNPNGRYCAAPIRLISRPAFPDRSSRRPIRRGRQWPIPAKAWRFRFARWPT